MNIYLSKEPVMTTSKNSQDIYILIFKTNVELDEDLAMIGNCFDKENNIIDWHIDREDIDKVLRIESTRDNAGEIINSVRQAGFFCEEL